MVILVTRQILKLHRYNHNFTKLACSCTCCWNSQKHRYIDWDHACTCTYQCSTCIVVHTKMQYRHSLKHLLVTCWWYTTLLLLTGELVVVWAVPFSLRHSSYQQTVHVKPFNQRVLIFTSYHRSLFRTTAVAECLFITAWWICWCFWWIWWHYAILHTSLRLGIPLP